MKKRNVSLLLALALTAGLTGCGPAGADGDKPWPSREITVDVAYTAGGTADTANRQLAKLMGETLGTNIAVVNVTGGSGSIAGQQVNNAAHDGYTWLGDVAHTVSGWRCLGYADLGWEDFYGFYAATSNTPGSSHTPTWRGTRPMRPTPTCSRRSGLTPR